jgi:cytochrome c biogenesis protein CcmG, thiol:disulfide interchange protein DsbE
MTPTLLLWFRLGVILLMAYTLFTYYRAARKRGYVVPRTGKDFRDLSGDLLTLAGGVFVLWMLQNNYQKPMDKVLSGKSKPFPELTFTNMSTGSAAALSDYRGKLVLVNLWATWCPPCRAEMPALSDLQNEFRDAGLVILALSDEDPSTVRDFMREHPYSFTTGTYQGDHPIVQDVNTRPASVLIDPEGKVIDMVVGARGHAFFKGWVEENMGSGK